MAVPGARSFAASLRVRRGTCLELAVAAGPGAEGHRLDALGMDDTVRRVIPDRDRRQIVLGQVDARRRGITPQRRPKPPE